ncbi:MAG: alpha-glucosidase [Proteobacteria bacterium]|nr:alpha-glucosidase [Pseudomonadota bacterium]
MESKIVLIGAGSAQFGYDTLGDIFQSQVLPGSRIVLHDINPDTLAKVEANGRQFIQGNKLPYTLSATTSRPEALEDADFCIISIEVGDRFKLWEQDWRIPQQYGIRQVYGENGGPGGLFHSLRIIPPILEICGDIQSICPEAFVFNFSNPMSRICTTVHRKYPDLKFTGLCHEIASLRQHLPRILDTPYDNLSTRAGGLNHFAVLLEAKYNDTGRDAYPDILEKAPDYFELLPEIKDLIKQLRAAEDGPTPGSDPALREDALKWAERRLFKAVLERFGLLPITTDSHFGEYIQWAHDTVDHKGILDFYHFYKEWTMTKEPEIEIKLSERVVPIIEGILTDGGCEEEAVNLPNKGLIDNLPEFMVVEVPARVDKDGLHGIPLGELPKGFAGLLYNQVAVHDLTAEAVLTGSREIVLQALLVDPIVDKYEAADQMLDTILKIQKRYLGYIK